MTRLPDGRKSLAKLRDDVDFYTHQIEGVRMGAGMTSLLLCDEMGLGKSLEALAISAIDFERGWASRIVIIVPASLKWNWYEEIKSKTHFKALVLNGTRTERQEQLQEFVSGNYDILICNYEQLPDTKRNGKVIPGHLVDLNALHFDIAIYDEAHYMKGHKSNRTKACLDLKAGRHFLLTGSPLLNQVNEFWPLLHRIAPSEFPNYWRFVNRFAVFGGYKDKQIIGVKNRAELTSHLDRFMIRRLKKDVLTLPEKRNIPVYVDFHPAQEKVYRQAFDELKIELDGGADPMEIENHLVKMLRLKQICGTPACLDLPDDSYKLDRAVEMVVETVIDADDSEGSPVVVFTQFRGVQAAIVARLEKLGIQTYQLHGDVKMEDRFSTIQAWAAWHQQAAPGKPGQRAALVAMIQVAGVGLNLTAANTAIFLDKLYVPKLNEQAEDRLHRIGATQPISIYEIIVRKSIEQRIETILRRKRKLFDSLVEDNSGWRRALYDALREEGSEEP